MRKVRWKLGWQMMCSLCAIVDVVEVSAVVEKRKDGRWSGKRSERLKRKARRRRCFEVLLICGLAWRTLRAIHELEDKD